MDEVPLTFDIPMNRTVEKKGTSSITIRTTGHEKSSFTVVLAWYRMTLISLHGLQVVVEPM
jgi:hypothetical protein